MYTLTTRFTPGASSSPFSRENSRTSTIIPFFAVRNAERSIAHVSRLLAEDRAEKSFLGGKLGLSLRSDLTDENVACANLCSDLDNAVCVKILERVFADVRDRG